MLTDLFIQRGVPVHIYSDDGPEFIAKRVWEWLAKLQVRFLYIDPADPRRMAMLNGKIFYSVKEAQVLIEMWRRHYNVIRPHSSLGYYPLS